MGYSILILDSVICATSKRIGAIKTSLLAALLVKLTLWIASSNRFWRSTNRGIWLLFIGKLIVPLVKLTPSSCKISAGANLNSKYLRNVYVSSGLRIGDDVIYS